MRECKAVCAFFLKEIRMNVVGGAGSISDGIDTIVFQGIEEIILPRWIFASMPPSLRACSDHGVRLSVAEHIAAPVKHIAAE